VAKVLPLRKPLDQQVWVHAHVLECATLRIDKLEQLIHE
jgi:hypothetical protein